MSNRIWTRIAAAGGIFYVVLTELGNDVLGSGGEGSEMTATRSQIGAYVSTHPPTALSWAALYIELLGILAFVFFLGSLWSVLRRAEGEHGPFSAIAFGAGLVSVGVKNCLVSGRDRSLLQGAGGDGFPASSGTPRHERCVVRSDVGYRCSLASGHRRCRTPYRRSSPLARLERRGALSGTLGWGGVRNILWLRPLRAERAVDSGDEHRLDPPCRRASLGRKSYTARGNHVGALGVLIKVG